MKRYKVLLVALPLAALAFFALAIWFFPRNAQEGPVANVNRAAAEDSEFHYSKGIDENGYLYGITAGDYVETFEYKGLFIPADADALTYAQNHLTENVTVAAIPGSLLAYQEQALADYYDSYAEAYGLAEENDEFLRDSQDDIRRRAAYLLTIQAIAEAEKLVISDEYLSDYFLKYMGDADYSAYEAKYGLPYLKQMALEQKVLDLVVENADKPAG